MIQIDRLTGSLVENVYSRYKENLHRFKEGLILDPKRLIYMTGNEPFFDVLKRATLFLKL